jgi:hypothetical protein
MKKFAIILSGQPRILNRSFLNYLDKLNIIYDIYINYWTPQNNCYENCGNLFNKHIVQNISNDLHEKIIEIYKPKKIEYQEQILFNFEKDYIDIKTNLMQNTISEFYGIYKAFNLIDNTDDYTHFIRIRFDFECIDFQDNLLEINNDFLYYLNVNPLNNILWIVPKKIINIFNLYNYIYETNNILNTTPEYIIELFLKDNNITMYKINGNCIIDRSYIKKGILHFNQGITDIFNCLGLIKYYTEKYNYIFIFMREDMKGFIDYYTKDIRNIKIIYISFKLHLEYWNSIVDNDIDISINNDELIYLNNQTDINTLDKLYIGQMDKFNTNYPNIWLNKIHSYGDFVKLFYESNNIDYRIRIDYFNFERNYELENIKYNEFINKYGKKYILFHSSETTCILENYINDKYKTSINLHNISILFYDYIKILEESEEIHLIDSSWAVLIYLLDLKYKIFEHIIIYYYPLRHNIKFFINNPLLNNWKIIYL